MRRVNEASTQLFWRIQMLKTILVSSALVAFTAPAFAGEWTATTSNGGTGSGSSSCERSGSGSLLCSGTGTWIGANGAVRERNSTREITGDSVTGTKTVSRNGRERNYSWSRNRRTN